MKGRIGKKVGGDVGNEVVVSVVKPHTPLDLPGVYIGRGIGRYRHTPTLILAENTSLPIGIHIGRLLNSGDAGIGRDIGIVPILAFRSYVPRYCLYRGMGYTPRRGCAPASIAHTRMRPLGTVIIDRKGGRMVEVMVEVTLVIVVLWAVGTISGRR